MKVSIVIGSHNRSEYLVEVIKSCKKIDYLDYEVIVIDSASNPLPKNVQKMCDQYYHRVDINFLAGKRNYGVKNSKGDVVVFTDDDCIVSKDWIRELIKGFEQENVICCTGRTLCYEGFENSDYEKWFAFKKDLTPELFKKKLFQNIIRFGHGNNMAFKREVFACLGFFDEIFGPGKKYMAADDTEMFYRVLRRNYFIYYNPDAIVYHKHLLKIEDLPRNARRNGFGGVGLLKKYPFDLSVLGLYFGMLGLSFKRLVLGKSRVERSIGYHSILGWLGVRR